ncbi:MAG: hypothetical protein QG670_683 [Thermoproteota archaeon]|nr:hypothetical protein [Thermoproteota archaeon]
MCAHANSTNFFRKEDFVPSKVELMSERFIGTWKLVSVEYQSDNEVTYPYGKDAIGYIMYSNDGYMSVSIMTSNRRRIMSMDMIGASTEEKVAAADTYFSYCGRYKVDEDKVTHLVEVSFYPNWVGEKLERFYKFEEDKLILSTSPMIVNGKQQINYIIWERIK